MVFQPIPQVLEIVSEAKRRPISAMIVALTVHLEKALENLDLATQGVMTSKHQEKGDLVFAAARVRNEESARIRVRLQIIDPTTDLFRKPLAVPTHDA